MSNDDGSIEFDPEAGINTEQVQSMLDDYKTRTRSCLDLYKNMKKAGQLDRFQLVEYRCPRRCLLLHVFRTPDGPAAYKPPFKLSKNANAVADPEAQAERTTDGDRRWMESADLLLRPPLEYWLNCDHLHNRPLTPREIKADIAARPTQSVTLNAVIK